MKKIAAMSLVLTILLVWSTPVNAAEIPTVSPYYLNAANASVTLTINDNGSARVLITCIGQTSVANISTTTYLEQKIGNSWVRVDIGTETNTWIYSTSTLRLSKAYSVQLHENGVYRVTTTFVLNGTTTETITCTGTDTF